MARSEVNTFDYVIVGGGTSGAIIAWRLGEAGKSVCVLEAGPPDKNPLIHLPAGFNKTITNPALTWQFESDPDPNIAGRSIVYAQGKTYGGSSSINGMIYNRGQAADFDGWAKEGNEGWSYEDVLPYFRRTETRVGGGVDPRYRGLDGRLKVTTTSWPNELEEAFSAAALNAGHPDNPDYNGASQEGVGPYQSSIFNGRRVSTSSAFLRPARKCFGVEVRCNASAIRVSFQGTRATGVVYKKGNKEEVVNANCEVIVAAGAINSPKLLQLSGIGPPALLKPLGIPIICPLEAVGENLRDHFTPRFQLQAAPHLVTINQRVKGIKLATEITRWLFGYPNVLSISPGRVHVFGKSSTTLDNPDFVILFAPASYKAGRVGVLDDFPGFTLGVWQMRPRSAGYVRIKSKDPDADPSFNPRYLSNDQDLKILLAAMRAARTIRATEPLSSMIARETLPGQEHETDDQLTAFARQYGATSYHLVGTCRMGQNNNGKNVVDARLRVHGVSGLRVVDASVMPMIPSANTAAATMMIGEKGSDMIIEDNRLDQRDINNSGKKCI